MKLVSQIFFFLKSHGPSTMGDFVKNVTGYSESEVVAEVYKLVKDGLIRKDENDKFHIRSYINAPITEFQKDGIYNYRLIQKKIEEVPAQPYPPVWINENIYAIPQRDQGERGTCVGHATAYAVDLNAIKLTDWQPDLESLKRNTIVDNGNIKFIKDDLPHGCASAECAYIVSREVGNIKRFQSGSFLDYAIKAWYKLGICTDAIWWTPKSANFDNYDAYPTDRVKASRQSELHVIDGYASAKTFDEVKEAIYKNGFVLMAINIFDNWLDNNREGVFPDPRGNIIGSHALCWVGYDEEHLYCLHSWEDWSFLGGISKAYYDKTRCNAFVPLDSYEADVAKDHYVKITITTDVQCDIVIGRDTFKKTRRAMGAFDPGTKLTIKAIPTLVGIPPQEKEIILDQDAVIPFTFSTTCSISIRNIVERIKSFLEALWT